MEKEYDQDVPNMRVMIKDVTIPEALKYKAKIAAVEGVEKPEVTETKTTEKKQTLWDRIKALF